MHPTTQVAQPLEKRTKLLVNLLSGGKAADSQVKFGNFYLIVDGQMGTDVNIPACYRNFLTHLKSKFTTGKGGDSAFKILADGSYVNAYTTIADSFKFIEESIATACVNNVRPGTENKSQRTGTALSGNSK